MSEQSVIHETSSGINLPSRRLTNTLGFLACVGMLAFGYYLQFYLNLEPCPMCVFQRIAILCLGIVFAIAATHDPHAGGARVYGVLLGLVAAIGASISARHVYLQNLPEDQIPACGPDLGMMLEMFPVSETIIMVLRGSGDCAEILWQFLGLSIPGWTFICLVSLGAVGLVRNLISR